MGNCPVIFAPSHRSYADFILMSYVCFTYDLEIPAIAAGMGRFLLSCSKCESIINRKFDF